MLCENYSKITGKVVKDPIFTQTHSGKSVCKIIIVTERKIGGSVNRSDYIPIALWAKKADAANEMIRKGDILSVTGSCVQERWETSSGEKRSRIVIQADKFWVVNPSDDHDGYIDDDFDYNEEHYDDEDNTEDDVEKEEKSAFF